MWRMLQQEEPEDYVIATGKRHSLEEFVETAFSSVGLNWRDHMILDPTLLRPVDLVAGWGNPAKARTKLGWQVQYKMHDVVRMMVETQSIAEAVL